MPNLLARAVRGQRRTPSRRARGGTAQPHAASFFFSSRCAGSAARPRAELAADGPAACPASPSLPSVRAQRRTPLGLLSVRAQRRTLAPGARKTAQPHAASFLLPVRAQRRTPLGLLSVRAQRRTPSRRARGGQPSRMPPPSFSPLGARAAPHARAGRAEDGSAACRLLSPLGARAAPHARAGRAEDGSAACPEPKPTKTSDKSWKTRSRSANEMADLQRLTAQARAFPQRSAGGPAPPSERAQTRVSHRAPKAPRVHLLRKS